MKLTIIIFTILNVLFFIVHEYDALKMGEWKMFTFLKGFSGKNQYLIFLYAHIPIFIFLIYYVISVLNLENVFMYVIVNSFSILHLILHIIATKWKSNVFKKKHSFFIMYVFAATGFINLVLLIYY